jgi:acyl-coenzyme A synthetase/AMP-(fatty) acid ligase
MNLRLLTSPAKAESRSIVCFAKNGESRSWNDLAAKAGQVYAALASSEQQKWALDLDSTFEFAYSLLGCWAAGKTAIVAPDHLVHSTDAAVQIDGIVQIHRAAETLKPALYLNELPATNHAVWSAPPESGIVLYTSGSTGPPKAVERRLEHMQAELEVFNELWGEDGNPRVYSTVSHRHVYGLLFRVLWPLVSGRPFATFDLEYPEQLLGEIGAGNVLISSPALLKRVGHLPSGTGHWRRIFSSGGLLLETAAEESQRVLGVCPIEVLGSTETSGVAWRQQTDGICKPWSVFPRASIRASDAGFLEVQSPFAGVDDWCRMGDLVRVFENDQFELLGRGDAIVKIEDKRVSLAEIEAWLREHPQIEDAAAIALSNDARQYIAVVIQLSAGGNARLEGVGRSAVIEDVKASLRRKIEAIAMPKKFRFVAQIPVNTQGKREHAAIAKLFD